MVIGTGVILGVGFLLILSGISRSRRQWYKMNAWPGPSPVPECEHCGREFDDRVAYAVHQCPVKNGRDCFECGGPLHGDEIGMCESCYRKTDSFGCNACGASLDRLERPGYYCPECVSDGYATSGYEEDYFV